MPIIRGGGVDQPVMATAARQVTEGYWLQKGVWLADEGGLAAEVGGDWCQCSHYHLHWSPTSSHTLTYCIAARRDPVILPFYHSNMGAVLPMDVLLPRIGKEVTVTIGEGL